MYKIYDISVEIAQKAHAGQKRRGSSSDYFIHPLAVSQAIISDFQSIPFGPNYENRPLSSSEWFLYTQIKDSYIQLSLSTVIRLQNILASIAILHDAKEDAPHLITNEYLKETLSAGIDNNISIENINLIIDTISILTRIKDDEDYFSYLKQVKDNFYARIVKYYDVSDNLKDLEISRLRTKYELAQYFLVN